MSEDIPDDIKTARQIVADVFSEQGAHEESERVLAGQRDRITHVEIAVRALHTERKKWDGASTFDRCMEK